MKILSYGFFCGLLALPGLVSAEDATIVGVYEDCVAVSSTVFVQSKQLTPAQAHRIAAQAEAAGSGQRFELALPAMIAALERNGIDSIEVRKQGQCGADDQGKIVQATVDYCGESPVNAAVYVDGALFFRQSGAGLDFDDFIAQARNRLQKAGVPGNLKISLNNTSDCQQ